jgi:type VI secretion system protein ImpJ
MRQMQQVLWTKGVLLSPQHLQSQDRFLEDLIHFRNSALTFAPWGFSRLEIDREALLGGSVAISAASGIFPDGLCFEVPASDAAPAPKPLDDYWQPDQTSLDVFLAVPEHRPGGRNVTMAARDGDARYRAEVVLRRDENTGLAEKPLQMAFKNLRILIEGESLDGYSSLRAARVLRAPEGGYQLDPRFIPPLIDIGASEHALAIARRLVEILAAKSSMLSGTRRQRNQSLADFGIADVANFWLLYTVNTYFPAFRHIFETRRGHPSDLYETMLALAGSLTTFSLKHHPRDLPAYDHADLGECFTRLDGQLRELLETVVPANHATLPLRQTQPSIFATAIDQDRYFAAPQIFLAVSAEVKQDELLRKAPQLLKISSADQIDRLIRQALPGVRFQHVPHPPSALPVKLNYQYFALDRSGPDWDAIRLNRNLAVYAPSDFPNPQFELVVILPQER